jgi:DNA-binding SARP family transcriptional activator
VTLGPARQRAVLGLLAAHQGVSVHRNAIVDALWPVTQPGTIAQLQSYVSRLRKLLGGRHQAMSRGEPITTLGATYSLDAEVGCVWLDVTDFKELTRNATQALAEARPQDACRLYEQALSLWRGEVLADVDLLRDYPAVTELAHQRVTAVSGFAEAALRARTPHIALPQLRKLCALDPYNEAVHAQLMLLLGAAGQQAAALDTFARLHRRLVDELGITPGPAVRQAQELILSQRLPSGVIAIA